MDASISKPWPLSLSVGTGFRGSNGGEWGEASAILFGGKPCWSALSLVFARYVGAKYPGERPFDAMESVDTT